MLKLKKIRDGTRPSQLKALRSIHDNLSVELERKEQQLISIQDALGEHQLSKSKASEQLDDSRKVVEELMNRTKQMASLHNQADGIESVQRGILLALDESDPAHLSQQVVLKQQLELSRQQTKDLSTEAKTMEDETRKTNYRVAKVSKELKAVQFERHQAKSLLSSLRSKVNGRVDSLARTTSFDPVAFSRRIRIEGKLARRRELMKRNKQLTTASAQEIEAASNQHPMAKLSLAAGTRDPNEIVDLLLLSTSQFGSRQEELEQKNNRQRQTLLKLRRDIDEARIACGGQVDEDVCSNVDSNVDDARLKVLERKLDSTTTFLHDLSFAIMSLSSKVASVQTSSTVEDLISHNSIQLGEKIKALTDAVQLIRDKVPLVAAMANTPVKMRNNNVRVPNRDEREADSDNSRDHCLEDSSYNKSASSAAHDLAV